VLRAEGDLAGARAAVERALRIDEQSFGPDHPDVAIRVNNLGMVLQDQGDLAGARAAFERALRISEKFLPAKHPNIATVRKNLQSVVEQERSASRR
jgi:tetratricopeptide (TPR) repeat protein